MKPLRIGIVGFGRAGKTAALEVLKDSELQLAWVARRTWPKGDIKVQLEGEHVPALTPELLAELKLAGAHRTDLVIDFAGSDAIQNYAHLAKKGVRMVSAVSHYESQDIELLKNVARRTAVLHSPNITIGVNLILAIARVLRKVIPNADIQILEEHFANKRGRSGTAELIADVLGLDHDETIRSIRAGGIIGKHELIFGLQNQTIRLIHESINRAAFAKGALLAGKWLMDADPGLYSMEKLVFSRMHKGFIAEAEKDSA